MSAYYMMIMFVLMYYPVTIWLGRKVELNTYDLCTCSIAIALTLVLEVIYIPLPTGATIALGSMIPLMVLAIIGDYRIVFLAGAVCGLLAAFLIPMWQPVHWAQMLIEHIVCFSCLGYTGVFGGGRRWKLVCGILLASVLKLCGHLLSGVIFFSQNAWEGWGAWGYSLSYNLSSNVPQIILAAVILLSLPLNRLKVIAKRVS